MNLSPFRQRVPRPSGRFLGESLAVAAGVFVLMLLLPQVGSNARALTAMRQDGQAKAVLSDAQRGAVEEILGAQHPYNGIVVLPSQALLRTTYPGYHLQFNLAPNFATERKPNLSRFFEMRVEVISPSGHKFLELSDYSHGVALYDARACSGAGKAGGCYALPYPGSLNGLTGTF
jgi:hypothetical protein